MIIVDTSGLLAAIDGSQRFHRKCAAALSSVKGPLLLSPFVLAELDYLLGKHVGSSAQIAVLEEVVRGAYRLEPFGPTDVAAAQVVIHRYRELQLGLADASIVVLADRHATRDVLTLDERHFRAIRTAARKRFRIFPADVGP